MDDIKKTAEFVHNKLKSNYLDQPNHPHARNLVAEVEKFIIEVRQQKNPLSLENRVKEIIKRLEAFVDDTVMDFNHRDELLRHSNQMRDALRQLS